MPQPPLNPEAGNWKCKWVLEDGSICPRSFNRESKLKIHIDSFHKKLKKYKCNRVLEDGSPCLASFQTRSGLAQHIIREHYKGKDFKCDQILENGELCQAAFKTKGELQIHIKRVHKEERPYKCDQLQGDGSICPWSIKGFKTKSELKQHISAVHLKEKKFFCDQLMEDGSLCSFSVTGFATRSQLKAHIKVVHLKLRQYVCTWPQENGKPCGHDFQTNGNLIDHIRKVHKGEIYTICDWITEDGIRCGTPLKHKVDYDRHINSVHKGIRPYPCSICGRPFVRSEARDHHQKSCIGETDASLRQRYHITKGANVENTVLDIIEENCKSLSNVVVTGQKELYHPNLGKAVLDMYCEGLEGKRIAIDVTTANAKTAIITKWTERQYQSYPEVDELWVIVVANEWDKRRCDKLTYEAHKKQEYLNVYIYHWSDLRNVKMMTIPPKIWELLGLFERCTLSNREEYKEYWEEVKYKFS